MLFFEKYYPLVSGLLIGLVIAVLLRKLEIDHLIDAKFDNVLNGAITFSSIVVGFLGVLLSIIATIRDTDIMKHLYENVAEDLLKSYFKGTVIAGFLVVVVSISLYFVKLSWLIIIWSFLFGFFILSSYRIIDLLLKIIFKTNNKGVTTTDNRLPDNEAEEIKKRFSEKISDEGNTVKTARKLSDMKLKND